VKLKRSILLALTLVGTCSSNSFAVSLYTLTNLGELNLPDTSAYDSQNLKIKINDNNEVVGWERNSNSPGGTYRAFNWNASTGRSYPLPVTQTHQLTDLNSAPQFVGQVYNPAGDSQAFVWPSDFSAATELPALTSLDGNSSRTTGINGSGQVVGASKDINGFSQAVIWNSGTITAITNSPNASNEASAINTAGIVTGKNNGQAFSWDGTTLTSLNEIKTDIIFSWGSDINNKSQIVGGYKTGTLTNNVRPVDFSNNAFIWDTTTGFTDLSISIDNVTWATSINDDGLIVGGGMINNITDANNRRKAILWENAVAFELNTLVSDLAGWRLQDATDINTSGHIVGIGIFNQKYHAYLLTPISSSLVSADLSLNAKIVNIVQNKPHSRALSLNSNQQLELDVTNHGPDSATNVELTVSSAFVSNIQNLTASKGNCNINTDANSIQCDIGTLVKSEVITFSFQLEATTSQEFDFEANVTAEQLDPQIRPNNTFKGKVSVQGTQAVVTPATPTTPITQSPSEEPLADIDNSNNSSSKSNAFGCTINKSAGFDPLFLVTLLFAFLGLFKWQAGSRADD